jgi:hypothetical protein
MTRTNIWQWGGLLCLCVFTRSPSCPRDVARPPARLSPADQAVRTRLRRAVDGLEKVAISRQQFERLAPRSKVPTWQRLQRRLHYPRLGALDLAFVLAYYWVDYRQNLQRLLLPDRRWVRGKAAMPESLTGDLVILHRKHHDDASLGALLDVRLDGGPGEEHEYALYQLWKRKPATLLRLAAGSKRRLGTLEGMVLMEGDAVMERNPILMELRKFTRHQDRRVAGAARRLLAMSKQGIAEMRR